jgi:hypothetical protein
MPQNHANPEFWSLFAAKFQIPNTFDFRKQSLAFVFRNLWKIDKIRLGNELPHFLMPGYPSACLGGSRLVVGPREQLEQTARI